MSMAAITWAKAQRTGSHTRKAVLMALADYADDQGRAWPSQARIADETEMSERSVRTALTELADAGFVTRKPRRRPDGTRLSDVLHLSLNRKQLPVEASQPAKSVSNGADAVDSQRKQLPAEGASTGKSRQTNRQNTSDQPAPVSAKPSVTPQMNHSDANASGTPAEPDVPLSVSDRLWTDGVLTLVGLGLPERQARRFIGKCLRDTGGDAGRVHWAVDETAHHGSGDPIPYVTRLLGSMATGARASPPNGANRKSGNGRYDHLCSLMEQPDDPSPFDREPQHLRLVAGCGF